MSAAARFIGVSRQCIHSIIKRGDRPPGKPGRPKSRPGRKPYQRIKVSSKGTIGARPASRPASGKIPSFGHRMLRNILDSGRSSPSEIATALGISEVTIDKIRGGYTAYPSLPIAVALERMFGIRCASWLEAP